MPRSPEWVKAKSYGDPFEWKFKKFEGDLGKRRTRTAKEKPTEPSKPETPPPAEQRPPGTDVERGPGARRGRPTDSGPPPTGRRTPPTGRATRRIDPRKPPGQDIERRPPGRGRQYGHAERLYPPGIDRDKRTPHTPPPARATPVAPGRQFKPIGPAPERQPLNEVERRRADIADLVAEVMQKKADRAKSGPNTGTGEIVSPGAASQKASSDKDSSIWTAEVVGHNEGKNTSEIKAIAPPSHSAVTGPIPAVHTTAPINITAPLPRTTTETSELPRTQSRQFAPTTDRRALPRGQRAVTARPQVPDRIGITQREEPMGQMSLFDVPGNRAQVNLTSAQTGRTGRQSTVPPSLAAGRQMELFHHPGRFKIT